MCLQLYDGYIPSVLIFRSLLSKVLIQIYTLEIISITRTCCIFIHNVFYILFRQVLQYLCFLKIKYVKNMYVVFIEQVNFNSIHVCRISTEYNSFKVLFFLFPIFISFQVPNTEHSKELTVRTNNFFYTSMPINLVFLLAKMSSY